MNDLYNFIYRGILTDESLNKAGRKTHASFDSEAEERMKASLSFGLLDRERLIKAERMAVIYTAIHAFENSVRHFVHAAMIEKYKENWWDKVPEKIKKKVATRINEESKLRWHGARGGSDIEYCDFGDLSSIIITNWPEFEDVLADQGWAKSTLSILERSRNVVMHGGSLDSQDIERIGMNIRDWIRQAG